MIKFFRNTKTTLKEKVHENAMTIDCFGGKRQYEKFALRNSSTLEARWRVGQRIVDLSGGCDSILGWCTVCRKPSSFSVDRSHDANPNLREGLHCRLCFLSARVRCALTLLGALTANENACQVYITEQCSSTFKWMNNRYQNLIGSEFFSTKTEERALMRKLKELDIEERSLRFEDITALTLAPESTDFVVSFDVLEHVPDFRKALKEFARILRPDGYLILTVPFLNDNQQTITRASISDDGNVTHHLKPEYHSDALGSENILAYYNFGWDLLSYVRDAGFDRAEWCLAWNYSIGLPGLLWTLLARR